MGRGNVQLLQLLEANSTSVELPLCSRFPTKTAENLMEVLLRRTLEGESYPLNSTSKLAKKLATSIKESLKALIKSRFRVAVTVVLAEDSGQGLQLGCRCFWDKQVDSMANAVYRNASIICVATAYAVYLY